MSQSGTDNLGNNYVGGIRASNDLLLMLAQGRSYSGRERNCCFLNTVSDPRGDSRFATVSAASGLDSLNDGRAISVVDWDHDGDLDLWMTNRNAPRLQLMINGYGRSADQDSGNFVSLQLVGDGKTTNRDAIGARVELITDDSRDGQRSILTVRAGDGFIAQSSKVLLFGLGKTSKVDKILVHWPGADFSKPEEFRIDKINSRFRLVQGTGAAAVVEVERKIALKAGKPVPNPRTSDGRIPLQLLLPAPKLNYIGFDGSKKTFKTGKRPVLVMLWSSDCDICKAELLELNLQALQIEKTGVDVLALSMDKLSPNGSERNAIDRGRRISDVHTVGFASEELVDAFQALHNHLMPLHSPLPIPSSFLIDKNVKLSVIYKGGKGIANSGRDVHHSEGDLFRRFKQSAARPGSVIDNKLIREGIARQAGAAQGLFALAKQMEGATEVALEQYSEMLEERPQFTSARYAIGQALIDLERIDEAEVFYLKSLKVLPDDARIHANLANIYVNSRDFPKAKKHIIVAAELEPETAEYQAGAGSMLLHDNNLDGAQAKFELAIKLKPRFADAHHNLGNVAFRRRNLKQAKKHYRDALQLQPDFPEVLLNLGNVFVQENNFADAIKQYQKALRVRPNFEQAKTNMARALMLQSRGR